METGVQLIADERQFKQIEKHGFTAEHHAINPQWYDKGQLLFAANALSLPDNDFGRFAYMPEGWDGDWFLKLMLKSYKRRLAMAGAFIAAELDRLIYLKLV